MVSSVHELPGLFICMSVLCMCMHVPICAFSRHTVVKQEEKHMFIPLLINSNGSNSDEVSFFKGGAEFQQTLSLAVNTICNGSRVI